VFVAGIMSTRTAAISGYRRLLRASRVLFKDDKVATSSFRVEVRTHYEQNRNETNPDALREQLAGIDEAVEMMTQHLVQAKLNEKGNYSVAVPDGATFDNSESGCGKEIQPVHTLKLRERPDSDEPTTSSGSN
jgi:complex III assembly factor LYRM7